MTKSFDNLFGGAASEQAGVWAVGGLVVFAIMWFVFLSPRLSEQEELRNSLGLQEEASKQEQQVRERLEKLEREGAESLREQGELQEHLAAAASLEVLLGAASQAASDSSVSIRSIERQKEIARDYFIEVPLRMSVSGTYSQLVDFMKRASSLDKLLVVSRLDVHDPVTEEDRVSLSAECYVSAYMPKDASEDRLSRKR
jgi:type IV pilus assembly protein PilO